MLSLIALPTSRSKKVIEFRKDELERAHKWYIYFIIFIIVTLNPHPIYITQFKLFSGTLTSDSQIIKPMLQLQNYLLEHTVSTLSSDPWYFILCPRSLSFHLKKIMFYPIVTFRCKPPSWAVLSDQSVLCENQHYLTWQGGKTMCNSSDGSLAATDQLCDLKSYLSVGKS